MNNIKPKWNIRIGKHIYKTQISLHNAYKIAERLQDEVLGIQICRHTDFKEARRMVEAG
jgi:hypothetical protein